MKFSALVAFLPLLLSSSVLAVNRDAIRARQAHVKKDLLDVCVALDLDVVVAPAGVTIVEGHIDLCLCLSVLPGFLGSNLVAQNVVNHLGHDGALSYFTGLIQSQKNKQQCHYPSNAIPFCSVQRPCGFTCQNGYTPFPSANPTQCVCQAPYTECNGVCGSFPQGCSSQRPTKSRRDEFTCAASKTMCGIPGRSGVDCVDTSKDSESCGGCTVAPGPGKSASGTNCKSIPNIKDVRCNSGTCEVISCKSGFKVSPTGDSCVKAPVNRARDAQGEGIVDDCFARLQRFNLLVPGFDIVAAKAKILSIFSILSYGNVLQYLLLQGAVLEITDLLGLADILGIDLTVL
ncbi:hypothetical protein BJ322DRAFT_632612 [Thelephora terrestris]|uniref:Protein CPL1-like domain-containing protein n=1 Tax=Thelephora terrestris TaxID=56493 RepID=A0A9P6L8X4_9AGAM|nr:hypothetical protein BJ322DRAFT_632612 [Thelephora terrestris]